MSDFVLVPISDTEAARVPFPLALPLAKRAAWLAKLSPDVLAAAERVPLPSPPTED